MESMVVKTSRGKLCLISENRRHYLRLKEKGTSYWNCYEHKCRANVRTVKGKITFSEVHSCFEDAEKLEKFLVTSELHQDESSNSPPTVIDEERMRKLEMEVASDVTAHSDDSYLSVNDSCSELSGVKKKEELNLKRFSDGASSNSKRWPITNGEIVTNSNSLSIGERRHIVDLVETYYESFNVPTKDRSKLWNQITMDYNETEPVKKTRHQLRKFWENLKQKLKHKIKFRGLGVISKLPEHEVRALGLIPKEEFGNLNNFQEAIDAAKMKKLKKSTNKFIHNKSVNEIMIDDNNSNPGEDDVYDIEDENPLAVSTSDNSSMDEQISFSKDPFSIPHLKDTSTFLRSNYGEGKEETNKGSIYQEEHFYDLDEEPSLEDTPNVHIIDVHATNAADFPVNPDSDIEVLPDSPDASVVGNINSVENTASGEASDPSVDPLFIDPVLESNMTKNTSEANCLFTVPEVLGTHRPQRKVSIPKKLYSPTLNDRFRKSKIKRKTEQMSIKTTKYVPIAPHINIIPAKTFQSTKPRAKSDVNSTLQEKPKPKIKVSTDLFETNTPGPRTENLTNPFASNLNLITFNPTSFSAIGSTATTSQSFSDQTSFKPSFKINGIAKSNYLFAPDGNMPALTAASPLLINPYPISVTNSIAAMPLKVGSPSVSNGTLSSNNCSASSNVGTLSTNMGTISSSFKAVPNSKATKPEEYLNFSRDYIQKRIKMEQTKFEFKMENLAKERQCIEERHEVEMKVLQLKLKYITAQYEDMVKRNR